MTGPVDRLRLRGLLPPGIGSRHQVGLVFRLPIPNSVAFLAGYLGPSRSFLRERYGAPWAYGRWWGDAFARLEHARESS